MRNKIVRVAAVAAIAAPLALFAPLAFADTVNVNFENPPYTLGNINGQDGWSAFGSAGSGCAVYDEGVSSSAGTAGFGSQSFRISDAVTSGCFGDQAFAKPLADSVGETSSTNGTFSPGTKQPHFEMQFDITATTSQQGLFVSVSPDRGDGSRMSYLGFSDTGSGIDVIFYDVQGTSNPANFVMTDLGTYPYGVHTVKLSLDTVDGASNDVVKVWIDGTLVHTGTSWENYYRYDTEASAEQSPRIVKTVLFRAGGTAHPANAGKGYLIDNLSTMSGPIVQPKVVIAKYVDGGHATAQNANSATFPMVTSWVSSGVNGTANNVPFTLSPQPWGGIGDAYEATYINGQVGDNYTTHEVTTGNQVVGNTCNDGNPFALVGYTTGNSWSEAQGATPSLTIPAFTNLQGDKYVIVWNHVCPTGPVPPPTNACATPDQAPQGWTLRNGTTKSDTVVLAPYTMFVGKGGNDTVVARDGNYIVCTGSGNDTIKVGNGNSVIDTGAGNDTVKTGDGDMWVSTGDGNDHVSTGNGNDTVDLGAGNNSASTGAGNDTITAGSGNDAVSAGAGTDTCSLGGGHNAKSGCEL